MPNDFAGTTSYWRRKRGVILRQFITTLACRLGRNITILDIGGRADYWQDNVGLDYISEIRLLTIDPEEFERNNRVLGEQVIWTHELGDARKLPHADKSFDLVHANSVIEHVGYWDEQIAMAKGAMRVGHAGWIQTPAFEFPIEPHFRAPFVHWFGQPIRRRLLGLSRYRGGSCATRRWHIDRINLMSRVELSAMFPECSILVERFLLLPKSYIVQWLPEQHERMENNGCKNPIRN
jgi:hypothetical protein